MTPGFRKFVLTAHIIFSVGWLGAVAGFLVLAIVGLNSNETHIIRSAYISMDLIAWYAILPSSVFALLTGIIQGLGTQWGLFKHYWVFVKLLLTVGATFLLILHMQPIAKMAAIVSDNSVTITRHHGLQVQLVADAAAALLVLMIITALSVYKPWGRIQFEVGKNQMRQEGLSKSRLKSKKPWGLYVVLGLIVVVVIFVVIHLLGGGMKH